MEFTRRDSKAKKIRSSMIKTAILLVIVTLPLIVNGHPRYANRFASKNAIGAQGVPSDFARFDDVDMAIQGNEQLVGIVKERHKRLSDQRRAELETLMALSKMTERLMNATRGGRQVDTAKIGRRRRSTEEFNENNSRSLFRLSSNAKHKGNAAYPVIR